MTMTGGFRDSYGQWITGEQAHKLAHAGQCEPYKPPPAPPTYGFTDSTWRDTPNRPVGGGYSSAPRYVGGGGGARYQGGGRQTTTPGVSAPRPVATPQTVRPRRTGRKFLTFLILAGSAVGAAKVGTMIFPLTYPSPVAYAAMTPTPFHHPHRRVHKRHRLHHHMHAASQPDAAQQAEASEAPEGVQLNP